MSHNHNNYRLYTKEGLSIITSINSDYTVRALINKSDNPEFQWEAKLEIKNNRQQVYYPITIGTLQIISSDEVNKDVAKQIQDMQRAGFFSQYIQGIEDDDKAIQIGRNYINQD